MKSNKMEVGRIYKTSNCGDVKVIAYHSCNDVDVEFVNTGTKLNVRAFTLASGSIKDPMSPSVLGVGYLGIGTHKASENRKPTKVYKTWVGMMQRCYSERERWNNRSYKDCTVCDEWHNFQNFAEWMESQNYEGMELDKDTLLSGNKIYSPDYCCFIPKAKNVAAALAKDWVFVSPCGDIVRINNLNKFCKENNLDTGNMSKVHSGKVKTCKRWSKYNEQ